MLDVATERLDAAWRAVTHLHAVADTPELRAAYARKLPRVTDWHTRLGADERLYRKYKALRRSENELSAPRRQALAHALRDFVLDGAELQGAARARHAQVRARLAELSQAFSEHVLDATDGYACFAAEADLAGVPADVLAAARAAAHAEGREGCKLTLHMPCFMPVMLYARDRDLRERLYRAYYTRASDFGPAALDNSPAMREILALRHEQAALLGQKSASKV